MDDLYVLSENNTQTGSVSSLGNVSDTLYLGEEGGEQFATVLSFNTTTIADTTLSKASLFLRRKSLAGTNPITGTLEVKVKNGNFGTTVNVEAADFTATADATETPCQFGSNSANGDWVRLDLPSQLLPFINNTATTQFIVSAPGATAGKATFYDSSDPEFAPVLNLKYLQAPTGIDQVRGNKEFNIYPNPTTGLLTIEGELVTKVEVCNMLGEVVLAPKMTNNTIDISSVPTGVYMLNIFTKEGRSSQRLVKN
jgi:hypothetical protein